MRNPGCSSTARCTTSTARGSTASSRERRSSELSTFPSCLNVLTRYIFRIYLDVQDRVYRKCFSQWLADPSPAHKPYQMIFRDLNMETSLRVFCGNYVKDENIQEISDKYWLITRALELVNFPFGAPPFRAFLRDLR